MAAGGCGGEEIRGILVEAAPHGGQQNRRGAQGLEQAVDRDGDDPVPGQLMQLFADQGGELTVQPRDHDVYRDQGYPAICRQAVVGDAMVTFAPVGIADA